MQASVWARYTEAELSSGGSLEAAKILFGRCLLSCPKVELHQQYLKWVLILKIERWLVACSHVGCVGLIELLQLLVCMCVRAQHCF